MSGMAATQPQIMPNCESGRQRPHQSRCATCGRDKCAASHAPRQAAGAARRSGAEAAQRCSSGRRMRGESAAARARTKMSRDVIFSLLGGASSPLRAGATSSAGASERSDDAAATADCLWRGIAARRRSGYARAANPVRRRSRLATRRRARRCSVERAREQRCRAVWTGGRGGHTPRAARAARAASHRRCGTWEEGTALVNTLEAVARLAGRRA